MQELAPIDLTGLMDRLSRDRPIFHSEADFQHALAWRIHIEHPGARIRLETRPERGIRLDVLVGLDGNRVAIEVKYLVRGTRVRIDDEAFDLPNHGAQDISRHDFIKDISRIERFVASGMADSGWAICLSNDSSYWRPGTKADPIDALFRLHEGRELGGTLNWGALAGEGTTRGRETPLPLNKSYTCRWRDFSQLNVGAETISFRYLALEIQP